MKMPQALLQPIRSWLSGISISLMDRYLATELIPPFCFSLGLVSSLGVAIGYLSDLANKVIESNLPIAQATQVLLLKVPEFIAYALPISLLLAVLLTYGRLSSDSELVALQACGVSLYRLIVPGLALSLVVTAITFAFTEFVVPSANYRATSILVEYINEEHPFWQTKDIFYPDYEEVKLANGETIRRLRNLFYAERFDGKKMKSLTVLQWLGQSLDQIVISDAATWNSSQHTWDFFNGAIYKLAPDASYRDALLFKYQQISLPKAPFDFALQGRDPYEMNIAQSREYIKILKLSGNEKTLMYFQVRMQQKLAFPFICLVFGLVGSILGVRPQHMSRATSFGLSIAIIFAYYMLAFLIGSLGMVGVLSPVMAGWLPNLLGLGLGVLLLSKFSR